MADLSGMCMSNESLYSITIFTVLSFVCIGWYASCFFAPHVIKLKPWELDAWIFASTACLVAALAIHSNISGDNCEVFSLYVHTWVAVHVTAGHTKTLRSIIQTVHVRDEARSAPRPTGSRSQRFRKTVVKFYTNSTYCTAFALVVVIVLVLIGASFTAGMPSPSEGQQYCYVAPSAVVAGLAYAMNLLVQAILVYVLYRIGVWTPVVPLQIIMLLVYTFFLGLALGAYVYEWDWTTRQLGWGTAYMLTTFYLNSQLLHFVVPAWVATSASDVLAGSLGNLRARVARFGMLVKSGCGFCRAAQLGMNDDGDTDDNVSLMMRRPVETGSDDAYNSLPVAVRTKVAGMKKTKFDTVGPPSLRVGKLTAQKVLDALITVRTLTAMCEEMHAQIVIDYLNVVMGALAVDPKDTEAFNAACASVYERTNIVAFSWPEHIQVSALRQAVARSASTETLAAPEPQSTSESIQEQPKPDTPGPTVRSGPLNALEAMASAGKGLARAAGDVASAGVDNDAPSNEAVVALRAMYAFLTSVLEEVIAHAHNQKRAPVGPKRVHVSDAETGGVQADEESEDEDDAL